MQRNEIAELFTTKSHVSQSVRPSVPQSVYLVPNCVCDQLKFRQREYDRENKWRGSMQKFCFLTPLGCVSFFRPPLAAAVSNKIMKNDLPKILSTINVMKRKGNRTNIS